MTNQGSTPPGWYPAPGDPPGTHRYWDGAQWTTGPQPIAGAEPAGGGFAPPTQQGYAPPAQGQQPPFQAAGAYGYQVGVDAVPGGRQLAEPSQRIVARLIDFVIGFVIALILIGILGIDGVQSVGFLLVGAVVGIAYEVVMVALKGGTVGKLIMGIGVQTHSGTYPPGWQPAFMRWLPSVVGYIPVIGGLIGLVIFILSLVWLFKDPRRQTVYDKVAKTYVVKTK